MLRSTLAVILAAVATQATPPAAPPVAASEAALAAMKVSLQCADAAAQKWHRGGYDQPTPQSDKPNHVTTWSYTSHYNYELKRCLIDIRSVSVSAPSEKSSPADGLTVTDDNIEDAIDGTTIAYVSHVVIKDEKGGVAERTFLGKDVITPEQLRVVSTLMVK